MRYVLHVVHDCDTDWYMHRSLKISCTVPSLNFPIDLVSDLCVLSCFESETDTQGRD